MTTTTPAHPLERRLWIASGLLLALIYSTLAVVRPICDALRERGLLRWTMIAVFLVVAAAVALLLRRETRGRRIRAREIAALGLFAVLYLTILSTMERAEEAFHFIQYGLVGALVYGALLARHRGRGQGEVGLLRPAVVPALAAILLTVAAGWVDEGIQELLPSRVYDLRDVIFNTAAGALGIAATSSWLAVRRS